MTGIESSPYGTPEQVYAAYLAGDERVRAVVEEWAAAGRALQHDHESCPEAGCYEGMILGSCSDECPTDDCTVVGHCTCTCHAGRTCGCGRHTWPGVIR